MVARYKTIIVDEETHKKLKLKSIDLSKSITKIVSEFANDLNINCSIEKKEIIKTKNWWKI